LFFYIRHNKQLKDSFTVLIVTCIYFQDRITKRKCVIEFSKRITGILPNYGGIEGDGKERRRRLLPEQESSS
jgi:hypothetical protein